MKTPSDESSQELFGVKQQDSRSDSRPRLSDQQDARSYTHFRLSRKLRCLTHFLGVAARIFRSVVGEIFDESAYARYLDRRQIANSRYAYAEFLRETESARIRKPRCC